MLVFLAFIWVAALTYSKTRARIRDYQEEKKQKKQLHSSATSDKMLPSEEMIDLCLIIVAQVLTFGQLLVGLMHAIPQFEHHLVKRPEREKLENDGVGAQGEGFGPLLSWCRFQSVAIYVLHALFYTVELQVISARLFTIFSPKTGATLAISHRFVLFFRYGLLLIPTAIAVSLYAVAGTKGACVTTWRPSDMSGKHAFYNCVNALPRTYLVVTLLLGIWNIALGILLVVLLMRKFTQLIAFRRRTWQTRKSRRELQLDLTVDEVEEEDTARVMIPLVRVMEKLTVLGVSAIGSNCLFNLLVMIFFVLRWPLQWMPAAAMTMDCLFLMLVFKWMDVYYVAIFRHRACCVVSWVRGCIGCMLQLDARRNEQLFERVELIDSVWSSQQRNSSAH